MVSVEYNEHVSELRNALDTIERRDATIEQISARIKELESRVTELQTLGTKHVLERQKMNRYGSRRQRQRLVVGWASRVFGTVTLNIRERAMRIVEEAIEVAQAAGIDFRTVELIGSRVFVRPSGDLELEMGGLLVTTLAMCEVIGVDADEVERNEIERILTLNENKVREKHDEKRTLGIAL